MRRDLIASTIAIAAFILLLGVAYPLAVTGIAQLTMSDQANGSRIERDGEVVGSKLVAQAFSTGDEPDERYFQPRPSQTDYSANATAFLNEGPNQQALADLYRERLDAYLGLEAGHVDDLTAKDVPIDAVTNSASGIDPHVSVANARIQAHRVAAERDVDLDDVLELVDRNTVGRAFGLFGQPGVNVLELNLDLDSNFGDDR